MNHPPQGRAGLGRQIGFLAHELGNALTVFFGVTEDMDQAAHPDGELLRSAVRKTEAVARALFELREELLSGLSVDPGDVAAEVARDLPAGESLASALAGAPRVEGERQELARLLRLLAVEGSQARVLEPTGRANALLIGVTFAAPLEPEARSALTEAARACGCEPGMEEGGLVAELPLPLARS